MSLQDELILESRKYSLSELERITGIPKSTIHRHMAYDFRNAKFEYIIIYNKTLLNSHFDLEKKEETP